MWLCKFAGACCFLCFAVYLAGILHGSPVFHLLAKPSLEETGRALFVHSFFCGKELLHVAPRLLLAGGVLLKCWVIVRLN
jgi:hypothetical protein